MDAARPYWKPCVKGMLPLKSLIFLAGAYTNCKMQLVMPAQKMQKEVRTDEWRTFFFADNLKSLRYSFRLSAPARGHDA